MNVIKTYSHLNGLEFLKIHRKELWEEIITVIGSVEPESCKIEDSREESGLGYGSIALKNCFKKFLVNLDWKEDPNSNSIKKTKMKECERTTPFSFNGTNFIKDRISIQFNLDIYDYENTIIFERHLALYSLDMIDVGISILPMKSLQAQMSSGVPYYEGELYNVIRQGRGVPAVPLVIVGIMP